MFNQFLLWFGALHRLFRSRRNLLLENLVLRQQLAVLNRRHRRPRLSTFDRLFWVVSRRVWSGWKQSLIIVTPETVVRWHRAGFRLYWKLISKIRKPTGRRPTSREVRELIFRMATENLALGSAAHPRRGSHARFRDLGTNDFPRDETSAKKTGDSQARAGLSSKSLGGHRGDGLLHCANDHFRNRG